MPGRSSLPSGELAGHHRGLAISTVTLAISEKQDKLVFSKNMVQHIVFLLLNLIARNLQRHIIESSRSVNPKNRAYGVIPYTQTISTTTSY